MNDIRVYEFETFGGETVDERGKSHWPDQLTLRLDKSSAWNIIQVLTNHLRHDPDQPIILYFSGQLAPVMDDESDDQ